MKKSLGAKALLCPCPVVLVGTYDSEDKPNIMTAAWCGVVNSKPASISVSLRKATYSYSSIMEKQAFTVSIPPETYVREADQVGIYSGRDSDKFSKSGLTAVKSDLVDAPYVAEFPLVLECKLIKHEDLGLHTIFIGEIVDVKIDENCLTADGRPDIKKINPFTYIPAEGTYYGLGDPLGKAFNIGK
ncbi:MAG: flavin reductase family protein [Bacillota bacterium]|nr:flavin reductase family protein [Bacillota bacterium]MDW7683721.1 flavin reductase family protein [Bacillota bacterium]